MKLISLILLVAGLIFGAYYIGREHGRGRASILLWEQWITMQFIEASWDMDGKRRIEEYEISGPEYLHDRALSRLHDVEQRLEKQYFEDYTNEMDQTIERESHLTYSDIYKVLKRANQNYLEDYREEENIEPVGGINSEAAPRRD